MNRDELMARLNELSEPEYAAFSSALIPGCRPMLGVRIPALRRLAKELARTPEESLAMLTGATFEEGMLRGLVCACAKGDAAARKARLTALLPHIDNWSICDSTAATCKFMAKEPEVWLPWLRELARSEAEFTARFGLVCLLDHFTADPEHRRMVLSVCGEVSCPAPYARLAVAWAVSAAAAKEPALGLVWLRQDTLDDATHNKAVQKTCESLRLTPAQKAAFRALKRKP